MRHLVEFTLQDGSFAIVEVDEPETEGTIRAARGDTIVKAKETIEEALDHVLPVTKSVVKKLQNAVDRPDELELTFGVKLTTVAGAIIAAAGAEANFEVTLRWISNKPSDNH